MSDQERSNWMLLCSAQRKALRFLAEISGTGSSIQYAKS